MKFAKRGLSLFAILCFLFGSSAYAASYKYFPDVPDGSIYEYEINFLKEVGIFTGDEKGNFNPNKTMTRAEAATLKQLSGME